MKNFFYASQIRIRWAGEKLDQLEFVEQRAADDAALKTVVGESSKDRMKMLFDFLDSATMEARRLISEYALHARAALDYVIFDLAKINTGVEQDSTQFPINRAPKDFPKRLDGTGKGILKHLTPKQVALVEGFQPYRGFSLLQLLHQLSNRDKHRHFVHIVGTGTTAPIAASDANAPSSGAQMNVNFQRSLEISLHDGSNAVKTLRILQTQLSQILDAFNLLLQP
jgi:hypothetical protein